MRIPLLLLLASLAPASAELLPKAAPAPPPAAPSTPRPLSAPNLEKLLAQLTEISTSLQGKRNAYNATLLPRLNEAAASDDKAFSLWLEATKDQDYETQGRSATEFSDFRNGKAKELRNQATFTAQLRLQCRFLALIILQAEATTDPDRLTLITSAAAYLDDLVASSKKFDGKESELRRNALESVIGRHLKLDVSARKSDGPAAYNPGNLGEIYQQMILPYYREKRAASAIAATWTKRIAQETALVELSKVPEQLEQFQNERLPDLQWEQSKDLFAVGQQETAAAAMMALIKSHLGHRHAVGWIAELAELAQDAASPPTAAPRLPKSPASTAPTP